jgi:hypothetical protein
MTSASKRKRIMTSAFLIKDNKRVTSASKRKKLMTSASLIKENKIMTSASVVSRGYKQLS